VIAAVAYVPAGIVVALWLRHRVRRVNARRLPFWEQDHRYRQRQREVDESAERVGWRRG
jgi:hypothetical protein